LSESIKFILGALETDRKVNLWHLFLACFAARANIFYFTDNVFILCLSCNIKISKITATF